jgi:PAS domain S-box-containing protein
VEKLTDNREHLDAVERVANTKKLKRPASTPEEKSTDQLLQRLVATTPDAMIVLNKAFQILGINPAVTTALAWKQEDAIGRHCTEVLKCRNLNNTVLCGTSGCPLTRVLKQKEPLPNEELIIGWEPGRSCEVSASVTPVDVGNDPRVVFTARDLTRLKMVKQVRANFVSMVSHELRTPLNSVHGFIDLLLQGHMGELAPEQHKYLSYAQEGVQQLISIVEDILFMTRSDSGQFEIKQQEVNSLTLVRQVMSSLQIQARKAEVALHYEVPSPTPQLFADPQRMKQVLSNLVTNGIKFTPPGGTVTIQVHPYDERFVMFSVSDTGYGILAEDQGHVFERFYQSNHSQQSKMGGYGLGLPIAKLIVEQHEGSIDFDSTPSKGSTFYFTVPRYREG